MSNQITKRVHRFVIYGIDIRDADFLELNFDNGASDSPSNWGNNLMTCKTYPSYQEAWQRLQMLYKENRENLHYFSFGLLDQQLVQTFQAPSTEERLQEIARQFSKHEFLGKPD